MAKVLIAPNGKRIRGTLETVPGVCFLASVKEGAGQDGRFEIEHTGGSELWWDNSRTQCDPNGERLFVDEEGDNWPESKLRLVDESEVEDTDA